MRHRGASRAPQEDSAGWVVFMKATSVLTTQEASGVQCTADSLKKTVGPYLCTRAAADDVPRRGAGHGEDQAPPVTEGLSCFEASCSIRFTVWPRLRRHMVSSDRKRASSSWAVSPEMPITI